MNLNYRNSLKPHLTSSYASKSGTKFGWGGGVDVIEMTHTHKNIQFNLFCVHLILRGCDPSIWNLSIQNEGYKYHTWCKIQLINTIVPFTKIRRPYASSYEIEKKLSLKTKNTRGYDEMSNRIIKLTAPFIIPSSHTFVVQFLVLVFFVIDWNMP